MPSGLISGGKVYGIAGCIKFLESYYLILVTKMKHILSRQFFEWLMAISEVKENLHKDLNKEPTEGELAATVNMTVSELRKHIEVGQAARNKLIKVRP
ncbi:RNA polymerase sigma factor sigE, chloroplastic/mitochondrial-like [Asparagus officinalis]|uniref:RNA polymerase sigma factor sigE, chloroplastic/mitochondrial-like n=1 Tax=Asparagus officinalis TaxID=4686 RepID=UPI00098E33DA|nr:RNA polymerase sigma factor sigE, chloroplastic/mitochondrial-like [Asparagus officinalis]XP_020247661.1 RNA polymerase sigma factor sigE, chloroplastic/mitochondrial-like [Asparagus officinalis]